MSEGTIGQDRPEDAASAGSAPGSAPDPRPAPTPTPPAAPAPGKATAGMSGGERMAGLGALIYMGAYLLFVVLIAEFLPWHSVLLVVSGALLVAIWARHNRPATTWPVPYEWLVRVLGTTAGVFGAVEFVTNVRYGYLSSAVEVLGVLAFVVGAVLMFLGARQMPRSSAT